MKKDENYFVHKKKALDHAITRMLLGVVTKTPKLENWSGAKITPEPLEIFDINGRLLFYEFSVKKAGKTVGRIKVGASKVLGPAVYTAEIGPRPWDLDRAIKIAEKKAQKMVKNAEILQTRLVCYSYPKIGVLVVLGDPKTKKMVGRILLDVATFDVVPFVFSKEKSEIGRYIWSMYDNLSEKNRLDRISRWESDNMFADFVATQARKNNIDIKKALSEKELEKLRKLLIRKSKKKSKNISEIGGGEDLETIFVEDGFLIPLGIKIIPVMLYGQWHCVWCAVASGQMILRYHNYYYEQNDIAQAMGTNWTAGTCNGGTTYNGIMTGMQDLSRNYLDAVEEPSPTWSKVVDEIEKDLPLITTIDTDPSPTSTVLHARVCSGYHRNLILKQLRQYGIHIQATGSLWINDPWPPNAGNTFCNSQGGQEYWEDWSVTENFYWPFIYIRPCTGTMVCQP